MKLEYLTINCELLIFKLGKINNKNRELYDQIFYLITDLHNRIGIYHTTEKFRMLQILLKRYTNLLIIWTLYRPS